MHLLHPLLFTFWFLRMTVSCLWICSSCMNSCWCRVTSTAWRALRYGDFWCVFSEVWVLFQTHVLKYESWQVNEQHVLHHQPFHALCPIAACVFFLSLTSQHTTCRPSWHGEWLVPRMDWAKFLWLLNCHFNAASKLFGLSICGYVIDRFIQCFRTASCSMAKSGFCFFTLD